MEKQETVPSHAEHIKMMLMVQSHTNDAALIKAIKM